MLLHNKTILGLDISTTGTGVFFLNKATGFSKYFEIKPTGNIEERIVKIYKELKVITKEIDYDIMAISKASYTQNNISIMKLEGLILSLSIDQEKATIYQPDITWYVTLPSAGYKDQRAIKKRNSLVFMAEKLGIKGYTIDDSTLPKEVSITTAKGVRITDNVSDAFCMAYQLEAIHAKKEIAWHKNKTQEAINKFRKDNKKIADKISLIKRDIDFAKAEEKRFRKEFELTGHKGKFNSAENRIQKLSGLDNQLITAEEQIKSNKQQIDELMEKKNNL